MDELFKKLDALSDLLKNFNASIKMPKMSSPNVPKPDAGISKLPTPGPKSKKDPKKIAEQLKNKELKPKIKIAANGQWSM